MNAVDESLLSKIIDTKLTDATALNIRKNGKLLSRSENENVKIISKEDGSGIDIYVKENTKRALVMIPVIVTESGIDDVVYNDFHIGKNANAVIIAGCAIKNPGDNHSKHNGIHRFFVEENANITYLEKHYGKSHGHGDSILDPVTEIELHKGAKMKIETVQIEGVTSTKRTTNAHIYDDATLTVSEKIKTHDKQYASTEFNVTLDGKNASTHVVSRSVATDDSYQLFSSKVDGNNECYGHVECDAILKDNGVVKAVPEITASHIDANLIHEATIGKIAGDQLIKLMSLGLSAKEAEETIINGFLK